MLFQETWQISNSLSLLPHCPRQYYPSHLFLTPSFLNNREMKNMTPDWWHHRCSLSVSSERENWTPISQEQGERNYSSIILKENPDPNQMIIWSLHHVPALIPTASHRMAQFRSPAYLKTCRSAEIPATNNAYQQPILMAHDRGVRERERHWMQGNKGQKPHTESKALRISEYMLQNIRNSTATKLSQWPSLLTI